ncbi:putative membrane protein, partial [Phytophthora megakarya]
RIFADFLNEHENTLVSMMQQGCTMITIFPMLRANAKRHEQAKVLLAKPKCHLDSRGCVFLYLQYRVATRNMVLLKHLFIEFLYRQDTLLREFVERGCQVISVIPFELPQVAAQIRLPPHLMEKRESPRAVEAVTGHEQVTRPIMNKMKSKRKGKETPWEVVYCHLPVPFEVGNHPELAMKFYSFWNKHALAVWERKFWIPVSRKQDMTTYIKRNNRQIAAKNAFEVLIVAAYEEFGASFFVMLDTQKPRHPGWWYRGPIVALFSLQQSKTENAMWEYVKNEAFQRFPDCKETLPLASTDSASLQSCHQRESDSMWMTNRPLTEAILGEIAALKGEQQATGAVPNQELGSSDPLELMEPTGSFV